MWAQAGKCPGTLADVFTAGAPKVASIGDEVVAHLGLGTLRRRVHVGGAEAVAGCRGASRSGSASSSQIPGLPQLSHRPLEFHAVVLTQRQPRQRCGGIPSPRARARPSARARRAVVVPRGRGRSAVAPLRRILTALTTQAEPQPGRRPRVATGRAGVRLLHANPRPWINQVERFFSLLTERALLAACSNAPPRSSRPPSIATSTPATPRPSPSAGPRPPMTSSPPSSASASGSRQPKVWAKLHNQDTSTSTH